jgi:hypothetical protein
MDSSFGKGGTGCKALREIVLTECGRVRVVVDRDAVEASRTILGVPHQCTDSGHLECCDDMMYG